MKIKVLIILLFVSKFSFSEDHSTIVLMYHRFDETRYPSTSISSKLFEEHLQFIKRKNINVLSLDELVDVLINKKKIPKKSVFITIDDAFKSFYNHAFPILKKYGFPFSIFVSTASISDEKNSDFMSWEMLSEVQDNNGLILNHSIDHTSFLNLEEEDIIYQVLTAAKKIKSRLGNEPLIFSYPYGESSERVENVLKKIGIRAAFAQHSAPLSNDDSIYRLPRFSLNNEYGSLTRLEMIFSTKKLPIQNISFTDAVTSKKDIRIKFESPMKLDQMNCFVNQGVILSNIIAGKEATVELRNLKKGRRHRLNCTLIKGRDVFWFGKIIKRIN